jgi:hypothetical protein
MWNVKKRLGAELGLGMSVLAGRDGFDGEPIDEIPRGIEYGFGVELPLGSSAGSASKKSYGGSATLDCTTRRKVHWIASDNR